MRPAATASRFRSIISCPHEVEALIERIAREQGGLHILVNDIWGATRMEWNKPVWESDLDYGLRTLRLAVDTHAITSHFAPPLLIKTAGGLVVEMTDGTDDYNATNYRVSFFYDLAKAAVNRMAFALAHELAPHGATAVASRRAGCARRPCSTPTGLPRPTGATPPSASRISPSPRARLSSAAPWRRSRSDPEVARWNGQSLSSGELAKIYGFTDLDGSRPDAWRYVVEVQDAGKPADVTGYR